MEVKFVSVVISHGQTQPFLVKDKDWTLSSLDQFFSPLVIYAMHLESLGRKLKVITPLFIRLLNFLKGE